VSEEIALAFFERLMRLHERMVLGVAYRLLGRMEDAQDAAQEVFLKLFPCRTARRRSLICKT
jgi:DNA-directed RNA polymerase specialized sigma24 family protein